MGVPRNILQPNHAADPLINVRLAWRYADKRKHRNAHGVYGAPVHLHGRSFEHELMCFSDKTTPGPKESTGEAEIRRAVAACCTWAEAANSARRQGGRASQRRTKRALASTPSRSESLLVPRSGARAPSREAAISRDLFRPFGILDRAIAKATNRILGRAGPVVRLGDRIRGADERRRSDAPALDRDVHTPSWRGGVVPGSWLRLSPGCSRSSSLSLSESCSP